MPTTRKRSAGPRGGAPTPAGLTDPARGAGVLGIQAALQTLRCHLDMDVAFVTECVGDARVFRYVDARAGDAGPAVGGVWQAATRGGLPGVIAEVAALPAGPDGASVRRDGLGTPMCVALRLPDGRFYGTFGCANYAADRAVDDRDIALMRLFGDLIARQLSVEASETEARAAKLGHIGQALARGEPGCVFQPVFRLRDGLLLGVEALARFAGTPPRSPDRWFDEAGEVGLQVPLELQAMRNAIAAFTPVLRRDPLMRLGLNAAPETLVSDAFARMLGEMPIERIAVEITEHTQVEDYGRLTAALSPLRQRGCKIAVDDAGSGYASLRHILQIEPDVIKLDVSLVSGIDASAGKRALASGLITFAQQTGCKIIAEGVETAAELAALRDLRVDSAQGYLLARPAPVADICRRLDAGGKADAPIAAAS